MNINVIVVRKVYHQNRVDAADARRFIIAHVSVRNRIGTRIRLNARPKEQTKKSLRTRKQEANQLGAKVEKIHNQKSIQLHQVINSMKHQAKIWWRKNPRKASKSKRKVKITEQKILTKLTKIN